MRLRDFLRRPWVIHALALVGALCIRGWIGTLRYRYQSLGPNLEPHRPDLEQRLIYAFWHENLLLPAYHYSRPDVYVLISEHADGQLIAEIAERLGLRTVRGSGRRGGRKALRQMIRVTQDHHIAITPDGPRGPRRQVQPGVIYLAAKTGLPIVPVGVSFDRPWRFNSWDRFALPRPWSRARMVTGNPIRIPTDADREQIEAYRHQLDQAMHEVNDIADQWAESGIWPEDRKQAA